MFTNEIVKGTEVRLRNGFRATIVDNQKRQSTRMAMVYGAESGFFDEMGSVYSSDIVKANIGGQWVNVELTENDKANIKARMALGF